MSGGSTLKLPSPASQGGPRRSRKWLWRVVIPLLALVAVLVGVDRAAAAVASNIAAQKMVSQGFPTKPKVTIKGFPFLTQVASRRLSDVHFSASGLQVGPVTASLVGDATGVRLNPGYHSGAVTAVNATILFAFSKVASLIGVADAPGLTLSAAGPDRVKISADLAIFSADAFATIKRTGPDTFRIHVTGPDAMLSAVLGAKRSFVVHVPSLPLGMAIHSVHVSQKGVVASVTGHDIPFGQ